MYYFDVKKYINVLKKEKQIFMYLVKKVLSLKHFKNSVKTTLK